MNDDGIMSNLAGAMEQARVMKKVVEVWFEYYLLV